MSVVPKLALDFTALASGTLEMVLADRIQLIPWRELELKVRVHSHNLTGSNTITVNVYPQSWTDEEPGIQFVSSTVTASAQITASTLSPGELDVTIPTLASNAVAGMIRITAAGTRAGAGTMQAQLSIEVTGKAA